MAKLRTTSWAKSTAVRTNMQANRAKDTQPEIALRSALFAKGLRYRVHRRPIASMRRTADIVFTRARVAVFVDGCFWHGCPEHHTASKTNQEFWNNKLFENRNRDADTDAKLKEAGWMSVRIWEHEPIELAVEKVLAALNTHQSE